MSEAPPPIEPDAKDWTWVLSRACDECGLVASDVGSLDVARYVRANSVAWVAVLAAGPDVHERRHPAIWSPLEYACHVRDVLGVYDERLRLMLTEDSPHYPNWDQDATAVAERYDLADPGEVAVELSDAAARIAARFDAVGADDWQRTGHRSDGASFTIEGFSRYFLHDLVHHLWDVTGRRWDEQRLETDATS